MKLIVIFIFIIFNVGANVPTVESLFRNGGNADLSSNSIKIGLFIKEIQVDLEEKSEVKDVKEEIIRKKIEVESTPPLEQYVKIYFIIDPDERVKFIQSKYRSGTMRADSITEMFFRRNFIRFLKSNKEIDLDRDIFYALLSSLILNNAAPFSHLFKRSGAIYSSNKEVLNREKVRLLEKYKKYLELVRENKWEETVVASPLKSDDEVEQQKINEILKSNMYGQINNVKLVRADNKFFWQADLGPYQARFSNNKHQLLSFNFLKGETSLNLELDEFIIFDGIHDLPKMITYKLSDSSIYTIRVLELRHFKSSDTFYEKRVKSLTKALKEKEIKDVVPPKVVFLY